MDNREWDRGKFNELRQNYHPRDQDDHYSQGKRRKFNDGGYQGYDPSQALDEYSQDHSQGQQARGPAGGYPKKRLQPSEPSPHVIFLGLDPDFTESDLQSYLNSRGCSVESVTIIRERSTGSSKGFGFAQFSSSEHARAFVDPLFPFVQVPPPASHGATATAAFYKSLETGTPHNGRRVKIDYSQSATPHEKGRSKGNTNDGTRDIGNAQAPVLLFRGLDPLSGPQAIHQAMKSSSGHGKEGANGMKRIILIKDKVTLASFGFAFVEFVDIPSASAVLAVTMSPQVHPAGFRISDRPVAASFAHPDSFQPIQERMLRDEACLASSLALGGAEGTWVRYWDETSTVAVIEFQAAAPQLSTTSTAKDKKDKKKKEHTLKTFAPPVASALPVSDKPVTLSFNKGPAKTNNALGPAVKPLALGFSADDANEESDDAEDGSKVNNPKGVAPLIASKKTINNINKWNQVQEELSGNTPVKTSSTLQSALTDSQAILSSVADAPASGPPPTENEFEFSDAITLACLLCSRQFKSIDQLKRHNKESDLHKNNNKDPNLRDVARQKMISRQQTKNSEQPKYRDRALERRALFNQPDSPLPENDNSKVPKRKQVEGPPPPPPAPLNPGQDGANVGNKLLKMMGWQEGMGLGANGEGRVDPIKTTIYAEGAGLGASKGKDVGKFNEGHGGYLSMAQESARERYGGT